MRKRYYLGAAVGVACGAFLLWLTFRNTQWSALVAALRAADLAWLLAAVLVTAAMAPVRTLRFRLLMDPVHPKGIAAYMSPMIIADFVNTCLPVNISMIVRPYLLTKRVGRPLSYTLAATVADRVVEAAGIFVIVLVTILIWPAQEAVFVPPDLFGTAEPIRVSQSLLILGARAVGGVIAVVTAGLFLVWWRAAWFGAVVNWCVRPVSPRFAHRLSTAAERFAGSLQMFRSMRQLLGVTVLNALFWGLFMAGILLVFEAFHLDCPWYAPLLTLTLFMVAMLLPNSPGLVGQYHLAMVVSLLVVAPGTPDATAKAVSIVFHGVQMGLLGLYGMAFIAYECYRAGALYGAHPWDEWRRAEVAVATARKTP